jgi:hypothetical protein
VSNYIEENVNDDKDVFYFYFVQWTLHYIVDISILSFRAYTCNLLGILCTLGVHLLHLHTRASSRHISSLPLWERWNEFHGKVILYYWSSVKLAILRQYISLYFNIENFSYGVDCWPIGSVTNFASEIRSKNVLGCLRYNTIIFYQLVGSSRRLSSYHANSKILAFLDELGQVWLAVSRLTSEFHSLTIT